MSQSIVWPDASQIYVDSGIIVQGNIGALITSPGTTQITAGSNNWLFDNAGNLTFPSSNLVITPDNTAFSNAAVISSVNNLITLSTGVNGGLSSLWVEDYANIGTSNIAAVYANPVPGSNIVRIAVGQNGGPGPNLWDFSPNGGYKAPILTAAPTTPVAGTYYTADGTSWDPTSKSGAVPYPVFYDGVAYNALY